MGTITSDVGLVFDPNLGGGVPDMILGAGVGGDEEIDIEFDFDIEYDEKTDSMALSNAGANMQTARAVMVHDVDANEVKAAILDLLGGTALIPTDGRLDRRMPKAHPQFTDWICTNLSNIQGLGYPEFVDPEPVFEVPTLSYYARYQHYRFNSEWGPPKWESMLLNEDIVILEDTFFDLEGDPTPYLYANEWDRFTDVEFMPVDSYVEGKKGFMRFRTGSGKKPGGAPGKGVQIAASTRMQLPDTIVKYRWFQVPYRYVASDDSWIRRLRGYVNQKPWDLWGAGELLYIGYQATRYRPPLPELEQFEEGLYSGQRLCDIEFTFLETKRVQLDVPTPANPNWIALGHNLLPWLRDKNFWYATSTPSLKTEADLPTDWVPAFLSAPYQLLFWDPDVGITP